MLRRRIGENIKRISFMKNIIKHMNARKHLLLSILIFGTKNINGSFLNLQNTNKEESKTPSSLSSISPQPNELKKDLFNADLSSISKEKQTPDSITNIFLNQNNGTPIKPNAFKNLFNNFQEAAKEAKEEEKFQTPKNKKILSNQQQQQSKEIIDLTTKPLFNNLVQQLPINTDNKIKNVLNKMTMANQQKKQYNQIMQIKNKDNFNFFAGDNK